MNFQDILNQKASDIQRLPPLPEGLYQVAFGAPKFETIGQKNTPAAIYEMRLIAPIEVDEADLSAAGGIRENQVVRHTVWLTEAARASAKEFAEACGIKPGNKTLGEMLEAVNGTSAAAMMAHRANQDDPDRPYLEVKKILPL